VSIPRFDFGLVHPEHSNRNKDNDANRRKREQKCDETTSVIRLGHQIKKGRVEKYAVGQTGSDDQGPDKESY
jgi:hypothetical protein